MRVGLAIETDSPGGAEIMLLELARELQSRGHEVVSLGPTGGEGWLTARFAEMGIERDLVEFRGLFQLGTVPQVAASIRARRLDVLHSHEFGMAVCGAYASSVTGCRHVITMHGGRYFSTAWRRRLGFRLAMALSRHTVTVSEASRRSFEQLLGVRDGSFEVVYNGVSGLPASDGRARAELGLGPADLLVLAVGNLLPVKGHVTLLEAMARLRTRSGRVVLAIAGKGPEEPRLRARAEELGIADDVRLLGFRSDIPDLLRSADVFAMPSDAEELPMSVIEAMLAGRAIVASDVGGIPELLPGPDFGVLVPPGDSAQLAERLGTLLDDPELRDRMGRTARARAEEHFTAHAMAERYLSLYGA